MTEGDATDPAAGPFSGESGPGDPLGAGYRMYERIGSGAMGEVRRGRTTSGEVVAVKILRPELSNDPSIVARFLQERGILTGLDHPNVVRVRDLVAEGGTLAIVMDLINGNDLRTELTARGTLPAAEATAVTASVLRGLAAVHAAGVVHRDVKPENVLLDKPADGSPIVPKVTDFGIAKFVSGANSPRRTSVIGTPEYMAPELIDDSEPTVPSDLYSVGIMLYELLCGVTPFVGGSPLAILRKHAEATPGRPAGIPDPLWSILSDLLAKDPASRPQSAALVAAALESLQPSLAPLPALAKLDEPPAADLDGATVLSSLRPTRMEAVATTTPGSRRTALIVGGVIVALLLMGGAAVAMTRGGSGKDLAASSSTSSITPSPTVTDSSSPSVTDSASPSVSSSVTDTPTPTPTDSSAAPAGTMPDVVGQNLADAASTLSLAGIAYVESPKLDATSADGTVLAQSTKSGDVVSGTVTLTVARRAQTTWLADISPVSGGPETGPKKVSGKTYIHSLATSINYCYSGSTTDWEYDLSKNYLTLVGVAGMSDLSDSAATATVEIYRDGARVFSKSVRLGHPASFKIDVTNTLRLKILTTPTNCGNNGFTMVIADPKLTGIPNGA
jgi:serine/threonine-protein kinase